MKDLRQTDVYLVSIDERYYTFIWKNKQHIGTDYSPETKSLTERSAKTTGQ